VLRDLVGRLLPALDAAFPTALWRELTDFLTDNVGATEVRVWLVDYGQEVLGGLAGPTGTDIGEWIPVGHGPVGRAFATQQLVTVADGDGVWVQVPVALRAERIGVLQVGLAAAPDLETQHGLEEVALTLAYVLALAPRYTDSFERARRQQPLTVAAEMQWSVLPARAFSTAEFSLAGRLTPAYEVGGDLYDFCVDARSMWLAVTDAMGHGVSASVLAALTANTLRNARRGGAGVLEQVAAADRALTAVFGGAQFVTGVIAQVELDTGQARWVNAGHPPPYRLRGGRVEEMAGEPNVPLGLFGASEFTTVETTLLPGDRLVFVSDGVLEGVVADGAQYAEAHLLDQLDRTAAMGTEETADALQRHLNTVVGDRLHDDATYLVLDWHGPAPHTRHHQDG
jgi:serine phosphatase RsbU (regulator of sigma subunit)